MKGPQQERTELIELSVTLKYSEASELLWAARFKREKIVSALNTEGLTAVDRAELKKSANRLENAIILIDGAMGET